MTPRDAILGRLGRGPATIAELYDSLNRYAKVNPCDAYAVAFEIIRSSIESNDIEHLPAMGIYRLTTKQIPNNQPKERQ